MSRRTGCQGHPVLVPSPRRSGPGTSASPCRKGLLMMVKHIPLPRRRLGTALSLAALCLAVLAVVPSAALADSPLPAPSGLQAQHVSDTSADLLWSSSGATEGDVVQELVHGSWQQYPT